MFWFIIGVVVLFLTLLSGGIGMLLSNWMPWQFGYSIGIAVIWIPAILFVMLLKGMSLGQ